MECSYLRRLQLCSLDSVFIIRTRTHANVRTWKITVNIIKGLSTFRIHLSTRVVVVKHEFFKRSNASSEPVSVLMYVSTQYQAMRICMNLDPDVLFLLRSAAGGGGGWRLRIKCGFTIVLALPKYFEFPWRDYRRK